MSLAGIDLLIAFKVVSSVDNLAIKDRIKEVLDIGLLLTDKVSNREHAAVLDNLRLLQVLKLVLVLFRVVRKCDHIQALPAKSETND